MYETAHASRGGIPDHADFTTGKDHPDGTLLARGRTRAHRHRPQSLDERGLASRRTRFLLAVRVEFAYRWAAPIVKAAVAVRRSDLLLWPAPRRDHHRATM